jgi:plasmid stability protein
MHIKQDEGMARTLQIREVPDDVHRTLRVRAAAEGISLSSYAPRALTELASRPEASEVLRRAGARPGGASTSEIVATVRAARNRRTS